MINKNFLAAVIFAFASVVSFFQINSYWSDNHHFNGFFGWMGIGVVSGLAAIYFLYKTANYK